MAGTRLSDVYVRHALFDGGKNAVEASSDPLVALLRTIDPDARAVRKRYEDEVEGPMRTLGQEIAEATFAVRGTSVPPDATFTLRLSVGVVKGYTDGGQRVAWATSFDGLYAHATGTPPLRLPQRWLDKQSALRAGSGSPVIDTSGNLVGLVFDGNLSSLPNDFVYDETTARCVNVDSAAILEALKTVYEADALVKDLTSP
jgi:hypothetical protein